MKVYLDDNRSPDDVRLVSGGLDVSGWIHVLWPEELIDLLKTGQVDEISLDHDLGDVTYLQENRKERCGCRVLDWLEDQVFNHNFAPPKIHVHSQNSQSKRLMLSIVNRIR